jgi:hypothetical protein
VVGVEVAGTSAVGEDEEEEVMIAVVIVEEEHEATFTTISEAMHIPSPTAIILLLRLLPRKQHHNTHSHPNLQHLKERSWKPHHNQARINSEAINSSTMLSSNRSPQLDPTLSNHICKYLVAHT